MSDEMTPAGVLLTVATARAKYEHPFANEFRLFVDLAARGDSGMLTEALASREMYPDEREAVNAVAESFLYAAKTGDFDSVMRVAAFALPLLAKWTEYLAVTEQHPRLALTES